MSNWKFITKIILSYNLFEARFWVPNMADKLSQVAMGKGFVLRLILGYAHDTSLAVEQTNILQISFLSFLT